MGNLDHFKTLLLLKILFLYPNLIHSNQKLKLRTPIEDLKSKTTSEIYEELKDRKWSETKVASVEMCDKGKCPKLMNLCPHGGNCSVTGGCQGELCACRIAIKCTESGQRASERGDDYYNSGGDWRGNKDNEEGGADYHLSESSDETGHDYNQRSRGPTRYREKSQDESIEEDTSSHGFKEEKEDNEEKKTTESQNSNKQSKEVRGPNRYREKKWDESTEEDTSSSIDDTEENKTEDNIENEVENQTEESIESQNFNKQSKEAQGPKRYREKKWDESTEEDKSSSNDDTKEEKAEDIRGTAEDNIENEVENQTEDIEGYMEENNSQNKPEEDEINSSAERKDSDERDRNQNKDNEWEEDSDAITTNDSENKTEQNELINSIESKDSNKKEDKKSDKETYASTNDNSMSREHTTKPSKSAEQENLISLENKKDEETTSFEKERELIKLLGNSNSFSKEGTEKVNEEEKGTTSDDISEDTDILAMGEKIAEENYKNGTRFKYCFDNVENCDESFAIKRCFKIRDGNNCVKQKKGCKFRKRGKRCCLMYKCQHGSKREEEDEDKLENLFKESTKEKDSTTTNDNQILNAETTMNIDTNSQEAKSDLQDKTTVRIEDSETETRENEKQMQKGVSEEKERDETTTISETKEDEEALDNLFGDLSDEGNADENKHEKQGSEATINIKEETTVSNTDNHEAHSNKEDIESKSEGGKTKGYEHASEENTADETTPKSETTMMNYDDDLDALFDEGSEKEVVNDKNNDDDKNKVTAKDDEENESDKHGPNRYEADDKSKEEPTESPEAKRKNGEADKKTHSPSCKEGFENEIDCKVNAQSWCRSQICENGLVGRCQYKSKQGTCCRKYSCKKYEEIERIHQMGKSLVGNLKTGQTTIHYRYKGGNNITKLLRPYHCHKTTICPALEDKGICVDSNLACKTDFSCKKDNCMCIVTTSCDGEQKQAMLKQKHIHELSLYGATSLSINKKEKSKCKQSICESVISNESDNICKNDSVSSCTTQLSCKDKCSCWININCGGKGDDEVEEDKDFSTKNEFDKGEEDGKKEERKDKKVGKGVYDANNSDKAMIPLPPHMYTEKLTLYIGRHDFTNKSDEEWHHHAEDRCEKESKKFDIGCNEDRFSNSHVFCMETYCVCYVQYAKCSGMRKMEKTKNKRDDNQDITSQEEISTQPTVYVNNESNGSEGESDESDTKTKNKRDDNHDITIQEEVSTQPTVDVNNESNGSEGESDESDTKTKNKRDDNDDLTSQEEISTQPTVDVNNESKVSERESDASDTKIKNKRDDNHDSTSQEKISTQSTLDVNNESNGREGESDESDEKSGFEDEEVGSYEEDEWDDESTDTDENYERNEGNGNSSMDEDLDSNTLSDSEESDSEESDYEESDSEESDSEQSYSEESDSESSEVTEEGQDYLDDRIEIMEEQESERDIDKKSDFIRPKTQRGVFESVIHGPSQLTQGDFGQDYQNTEESQENPAVLAETIGDNYLNPEEKLLTRKTFYQAHIFPLHMLEKLKGGGESSTYMKSEKCTQEDMCPRVEFFCGESGGECSAEADCNDKTDEGCLCTLRVTCA